MPSDLNQYCVDIPPPYMSVQGLWNCLENGLALVSDDKIGRTAQLKNVWIAYIVVVV
jgi:hypothetical protein